MKIQIPAKLTFLYEPARYKIAWGGRGGAKSESFSDALVTQGMARKLKILCAREIQSSLAESVHAVLRHSINKLGLQTVYEIQDAVIFNKTTGTEFIFAGIRHNIGKIKSMFGVDICWVEEAANVSKTSWEILIPTIRKEGSEIWVSFNPELDTDETYKRFVLDPPENAKVVKINFDDNPWFPETLRIEKDSLKIKDYDAYLNVWEGHCRQTIEGAVYAKELQQATQGGRICRVPIMPGRPIETFWDLGKRDHTAIWFAQIMQGEYRIVDFYQNRGEYIDHYLKILQGKSYLYGTHWLPHDGAADNLRGLSIERQIKAIYPDKVKVLDRISNITAGIDAARSIFPLCYFDEKNCAEGLQALRHYKYAVDPDTKGYSKYPLHDENSDAADAFRQIAMAVEAHKPKPQPKTVQVSKYNPGHSGLGWLAN